jgi:hypothetical protein
VQRDRRVVVAGQDEVTDGDAMPAGPGDGGRAVVDGVAVEALVERVSHFGGITEQECIFAGGGVGFVAGERVGGHGDCIPAAQPVVGAVLANSVAHRRRPPL